MEQELYDFLVSVQVEVLSIQNKIDILTNELSLSKKKKISEEKLMNFNLGDLKQSYNPNMSFDKECLMITKIAKELVNEKNQTELTELKNTLALYPSAKQIKKLELALFNSDDIIKEQIQELFLGIPCVNEDIKSTFLELCVKREKLALEKKIQKSNERIEQIRKLREVKNNIEPEVISYVEPALEASEITYSNDIDNNQQQENIEDDKVVDSLYCLLETGIHYDLIENLLPKEDNRNFFYIKNKLLEKIEENYNFWLDIYNDSEGIDKEESRKSMEKCIRDMMFVKNYFARAVAKSKIEKEEEKPFNLIFAKTKFDTPHVLSDLENIPEEYRGKVKKLLEDLVNCKLSTSSEKCRKLSNNVKLADVYELKEFKVRLIYKNLGNNNFYVMGINYKKSNSDRFDIDKIGNRNMSVSNEFVTYKKLIESGADMSDIREESKDIYDELINQIDNTKRGKTKKI